MQRAGGHRRSGRWAQAATVAAGGDCIGRARAERQQGCVVGLHFHLHQADYWYVPFGVARVVLHDLRVGSPTDGATLTIDLGTRPDGSEVSIG